MIKNILQFSHQLLADAVQVGETVIDATCGNGNDTIFLSNLVGDSGTVLAFDIQKQAIDSTKRRLIDEARQNVKLIHDGHERVTTYLLKEQKHGIAGAIFNLGYLPRSDKTIITKSESTLQAIQQILDYLKTNGVVVIVIYYGHEGGLEEKENVITFVKQLDQSAYHVLRYEFINQKNNPPFVVAIQKRKEKLNK
ncbi:class I SAM-dependent methyltransferase [Virgibacillus soli]|uniref:Class I SAM-dependent methyltransferase n=1 Tax=Paracerasibacillus soli TaxID=480284 RepID=A0ABU5CS88_9BACI|nr:class I SAM-dependent methyltransferase [Virgibacillus soli]MDY0408746.1 class I SAM-dependent methyltransferase [Virgibacillus soli]